MLATSKSLFCLCCSCLVLTKARAVAVAKCNNGYVRTYAEASVERKVLGFCGLLEEFGINYDDFGRGR
jgi:hypothetical protein